LPFNAALGIEGIGIADRIAEDRVCTATGGRAIFLGTAQIAPVIADTGGYRETGGKFASVFGCNAPGIFLIYLLWLGEGTACKAGLVLDMLVAAVVQGHSYPVSGCGCERQFSRPAPRRVIVVRIEGASARLRGLRCVV